MANIIGSGPASTNTTRLSQPLDLSRLNLRSLPSQTHVPLAISSLPLLSTKPQDRAPESADKLLADIQQAQASTPPVGGGFQLLSTEGLNIPRLNIPAPDDVWNKERWEAYIAEKEDDGFRLNDVPIDYSKSPEQNDLALALVAAQTQGTNRPPKAITVHTDNDGQVTGTTVTYSDDHHVDDSVLEAPGELESTVRYAVENPDRAILMAGEGIEEVAAGTVAAPGYLFDLGVEGVQRVTGTDNKDKLGLGLGNGIFKAVDEGLDQLAVATGAPEDLAKAEPTGKEEANIKKTITVAGDVAVAAATLGSGALKNAGRAVAGSVDDVAEAAVKVTAKEADNVAVVAARTSDDIGKVVAEGADEMAAMQARIKKLEGFRSTTEAGSFRHNAANLFERMGIPRNMTNKLLWTGALAGVAGGAVLVSDYLTDSRSTKALAQTATALGGKVADAVEVMAPHIAEAIRKVGPEAVAEAVRIVHTPTRVLSTSIATVAEETGIDIDPESAMAAAQLVEGDLLFASLPILLQRDISEEELARIALEAFRSEDRSTYFANLLGVQSGNLNDIRAQLVEAYDPVRKDIQAYAEARKAEQERVHAALTGSLSDEFQKASVLKDYLLGKADVKVADAFNDLSNLDSSALKELGVGGFGRLAMRMGVWFCKAISGLAEDHQWIGDVRDGIAEFALSSLKGKLKGSFNEAAHGALAQVRKPAPADKPNPPTMS